MSTSRLAQYAPDDFYPVFEDWAKNHGLSDAQRRVKDVVTPDELAEWTARYTRSQRGHFRGEG